MNLRFLYILLMCMCVTVAVSGQTFSDTFEQRHPEDDDFRDITVDESLFQNLDAASFGGIYSAEMRYGFRFTQMRPRGLDNSFATYRLRGTDISERINGTPDYALYSALSDVTLVRYGSAEADGAAIGNIVNYVAYSNPDNGQYSLSGSYSDRRNRGNIKFSGSGRLGERGWSYALRGARRWGKDSHIDGVFGDMFSLSALLSKIWRDGSVLSLFMFAAPTEQGVRSWSTREVFELTGNNLYNPSWGEWGGGKIRNSRVRNNFTPIVNMGYIFRASSETVVNVSLYGRYGLKRYSSIDWWNAPNPNPDYYTFLPSGYSDPALSEKVAEEWRSGNQRYTQIDWENMRTVNAASAGNRNGAAYIIGSRVERVANVSAEVTATTNIPDAGVVLEYGVGYRSDNSRFFKEAKDLLGASYVYNIDRFELKSNDSNAADERVYEGGRYDYDYSIVRGEANVRFGGDYRAERLSMFWRGELRMASLRREGHFNREGMADSYGRSENQNRTTYNIRVGYNYRFNAAYSINGSVYAASSEPDYETLFLYPVYSNRTFTNVDNARLTGAEAMFAARPVRWLEAEAAVYYHTTTNRTDVYRYYDDYFGSYSIMRVDGLQWTGYGVELGARVAISDRITLNLAAALNKYEYTSDPKLNIVAADTFQPLLTDGVSRLNGYVPVTSPRKLTSVTLSYRIPYKWRFSLNYQHASGRSIGINPLRRASHIMASAWSPESLLQTIRQERLPSAGVLNLYVQAQFKIAGTVSCYASVSVQNLLDKRDIIYGGYEQMRFHKDSSTGSYTPFDSKYSYHYPRTFIISLSCYI